MHDTKVALRALKYEVGRQEQQTINQSLVEGCQWYNADKRVRRSHTQGLGFDPGITLSEKHATGKDHGQFIHVTA